MGRTFPPFFGTNVSTPSSTLRPAFKAFKAFKGGRAATTCPRPAQACAIGLLPPGPVSREPLPLKQQPQYYRLQAGTRPEHSPSDPLEPRIAMAHRLDLVCRCQLTTPPVHVRNMQPMRCAHHGLLPTPRTLLSCPDLHLLSCSRQKLNKNILTMLVHLLPSNHTQRFPANHIQRI